MINLTIDGKNISVPEETTVLDAARLLDVNIPTLCHDPRLKPYGGCRLCIVEVEGVPRPVTACTTPVTNAMVVTTESDKLYKLRRTVIEFLLSDHPNDCMVCQRAGDCTKNSHTSTACAITGSGVKEDVTIQKTQIPS